MAVKANTIAAEAQRTRQVVFADIGASVRTSLQRIFIVLVVVCTIVTGYLFATEHPGALAFLLIAGSSLAALKFWIKAGRGLPTFALFAAQNLFLYGLPLAGGNESILGYPASFYSQAGWEVAIFNLALTLGWGAGMRFITPGSNLCYALLGLTTASNRLTRLGLALVAASTAYLVSSVSGAIDFILSNLPAGSGSIIFAAISAMSASGFFLTGMMIGRGQATRLQRSAFWIMLAAQCFVTAAGFLLSPAVIVITATVVGLYWGSGKIPARLLITVFVVFGYLNLGKFVMREKYWGTEGADAAVQISLAQMPETYREWAGVSFEILTGESEWAKSSRRQSDSDETEKGQTLLERINNLSNLLFVIDAMETRHIRPLNGATYTLIPPLLVPRILWPNKPRSHEGQVLLNVYFGRQDLSSTFHTYIAWGILPEAYGNFGPIKGAAIVGLFLGLIAAWIEQATVRKLVLSLEGFLAFTTFLMLANSYEMVASVFVTALYQALIPIIAATSPFVARIQPSRLEKAAS